jgi:hypothetical protein
MDYYEIQTSKICALLSPKKTELKEKCFVLSAREEYLQTRCPKKKVRVARLLDPQYESSIQKNKNGDPFGGTQ